MITFDLSMLVSAFIFRLSIGFICSKELSQRQRKIYLSEKCLIMSLPKDPDEIFKRHW